MSNNAANNLSQLSPSFRRNFLSVPTGMKESLQPESRFLLRKTNGIPDSIFFRLFQSRRENVSGMTVYNGQRSPL